MKRTLEVSAFDVVVLTEAASAFEYVCKHPKTAGQYAMAADPNRREVIKNFRKVLDKAFEDMQKA